MARKKQKLINYHSGLILSAETQLTEAQIAGNLSYGEITVIHAPEQPLIGTKTGDNTVAWFMSSGQVETSIHNAITGATGDISQLQTDVRNLSSATETYINTTAPNTYLTMQSAATAYYTSGQVESTYLKQEDAANTYLTMSSAASTYATSGDVVNALNSISGVVTQHTTDISNLQQDVNDLKDFSGYVETNYATKTYATNQATAASATAYNSAVTYVTNTLADYAYSSITHTEIEAEKNRAEGIEGALRSDVDTLSGYMETITEEGGLSATVIADHAIVTAITTTYETKDDANTKYTSAITYVNTASGNIETHLHEGYWDSATTKGKLDTIDQHIEDVSGAVIATSAAVITLSGDVIGYVDTKVSSVYRYKGSKDTKDELPTTGNEVGDVWNVVGGSGSIGDADYVPPGTNYAWTGSAWDALGGTIDLSTYATKSQVSAITNSLDGRITTLETNTGNNHTDIVYVSGQVDTLSGKVASDYYTKTVADETFLKIADADKKYYTSGQVETTYLKKEDAQNTYLTITSANSIVTTITSDISSLSSATQTIETKANNSISAVTTDEVTTADNDTETVYASGVKIDTDNAGRVTKFDFSELIVDCGDY